MEGLPPVTTVNYITLATDQTGSDLSKTYEFPVTGTCLVSIP